MQDPLNITVEYIIDRPIEVISVQLDTIASAPFNDSNYTIFGDCISYDPFEFVFMAKWMSMGKPLFTQGVSTTITVRLMETGNKSKIVLSTKTNPSILVFFFLSVGLFFINLLEAKNSGDIKMIITYLLLPILILAFDRFIKKMLVGSFERDMKLKSAA